MMKNKKPQNSFRYMDKVTCLFTGQWFYVSSMFAGQYNVIALTGNGMKVCEGKHLMAGHVNDADWQATRSEFFKTQFNAEVSCT